MVMVMMMMVVTDIPVRSHHNHRAPPMMMVLHLHELSLGRCCSLLAVHGLENGAGIRDRFQQICV